MSGSPSPSTSTQTTSTNLSPDQQQLLGLAMPSLQQYAANPTTVPTSGLVAPFTPNQISGQNQVAGANSTQQGVVSGGANASNFLTSGAALDPNTNPAEAAQIKAATQPIYDNLADNTLPQLQEQATSVGQTGSSRAGVAEGLATRGANEAAGQASANVANTDYNAGLNAMTQALGMTPATAASQAIPGATTSAVGDTQQQQQQQMIDAQLEAELYNSQQPLATGEALAGIASGIPGASVTSTGTTQPSTPSLLSQILGGGALASAAIGSLPGTAASGASTGGSGIGGLLAALLKSAPTAAAAA